MAETSEFLSVESKSEKTSKKTGKVFDITKRTEVIGTGTSPYYPKDVVKKVSVAVAPKLIKKGIVAKK